jgi:hypothetical protein
MQRISSALLFFGACTLGRAARADLPSTAPIYGSTDLDAIGAALEHSVSATGQNDSLREEAERRLRASGDDESIGVGSTATSVGATMLFGGIGLATSADWNSKSCAACFPAVLLTMGGAQLTLAGLIALGEYGGPHHNGRGYRRRVNALVAAMEHPSIAAANATRRHRLTFAWTFLMTGVALAGSGVALFAMGHQSGFDDGVREGIAAAGAFTGGWLVTIGSGELSSKWANEMAVAPTRGGAMLTYERRF